MTLPADETLRFGLFLGIGVVATLGSIGFWAVVERVLVRRTLIYDVPLRDGQLVRELVGNLLFILVFAAGMTLLYRSNAVEVSSFTWIGAIITFLGGLISFDVYYYGLHSLLHTRLGTAVHDWHHQSRVNTPWTALSLSPVESAAWVLGLALWPLLTASYLPFVLEGWFAWLVFFWFSNTMGHINVEIVPAFVSSHPIGRKLSHAITYHAMHHARYKKHLCFFMNSLDDLFGQTWPDYPALHKQVAQGEPMMRLGERGTSAQPDGSS